MSAPSSKTFRASSLVANLMKATRLKCDDDWTYSRVPKAQLISPSVLLQLADLDLLGSGDDLDDVLRGGVSWKSMQHELSRVDGTS